MPDNLRSNEVGMLKYEASILDDLSGVNHPLSLLGEVKINFVFVVVVF